MNSVRARIVARSASWSALLDPGLALGLAVVAVASAQLTAAAAGLIDPVPTAALGVATALPIAVRRRRPTAVLVLVAAGVLAESALGLSLNFSGFGLALAVFTVGSDAPRRDSVATLAALPLYLIAADALYSNARGETAAVSIANLAAGLLIFVVAWVAGESVRSRRLRTARLEARAARLEAEQEEAARTAVRAERALIARELHDVVAHSVSVMVVQAGAARRVMEDRPDEARDALLSIESTGREALTELRRLLGVLRTDEAPAPLEPQQGLAGLGALLAQAGATGMQVELVVEGEPRALGAGLDLAAYRVVQEALTNAIKHADRARATVRLRYERDALTIEVVDDGRPAGSAASAEGIGPAGAGPAMSATGAGQGLVGMRERVALYGGELSAGPRPTGGFAIRARLPLEVQST